MRRGLCQAVMGDAYRLESGMGSFISGVLVWIRSNVSQRY
jgi:hypothetical protein